MIKRVRSAFLSLDVMYFKLVTIFNKMIPHFFCVSTFAMVWHSYLLWCVTDVYWFRSALCKGIPFVDPQVMRKSKIRWEAYKFDECYLSVRFFSKSHVVSNEPKKPTHTYADGSWCQKKTIVRWPSAVGTIFCLCRIINEINLFVAFTTLNENDKCVPDTDVNSNSSNW